MTDPASPACSSSGSICRWLSFAAGLSPALLWATARPWAWFASGRRTALFGLRWIAGVKVEIPGLEHVPTGGALVASKHQGMLDVVAP